MENNQNPTPNNIKPENTPDTVPENNRLTEGQTARYPHYTDSLTDPQGYPAGPGPQQSFPYPGPQQSFPYNPNPQPGHPQGPRMNRRNRSGWTTALIVGGALLLAVLVWWRILSRNSSDAGYESSPDEYALEESYATDPGDEGYGAEANDYGDAAVTSDVTDASASEMSPREAEAGAVATLLPLDTPMSYTGTINPGGVATLNLTYFSTGRIMGTLDYSSGRHLEVIGHYTFRNSDRMVDLSLTTANADDPSYSESWTGHSSVVKDDMAHTLTFKEIYTSKGGAMTASFALRP